MATITLKGKVSRGVGEGRIFTCLDWARRQFQEKIGFEPYPGTLNIQLVGKDKEIELLMSFKGIKIEPPKGFLGGRCFRVLIMKKIAGAIVLPDSSQHQSNVLEILAPVNLRKRLSLDDGDEVDVDIQLE